jgi:protein ImuB
VLAAVDAAAQGLGLHPGLSLAEAQARIPALKIVDADLAGDAAALVELAAWHLRYTPLTVADHPSGLWLDVTGCAHLLGGEAAMLADMRSRLRTAGISARVAIADTLGAAHAVARYGRPDQAIVLPGGHAAVLRELPIAALRIDRGTVDGLRRLGFERIGQLMDKHRAPFARRFGPMLLRRFDQAVGRAPEPISWVLPPEMIRERLAFAEPILTPDSLAFVIDRLAVQVCTALELAGQGARQADLVFERTDHTRQVIRIGTSRPLRDPARLARLLVEKLISIDPEPGVDAMFLAVTLAEPFETTQLASGLDDDDDTSPDLSDLIDRFTNRFGASNVYREVPAESDVPERSTQFVDALAPEGGTWSDEEWPFRLLSNPEHIDVMALLPDHPPVAFTWRGKRRRVIWGNGPQRVYGEWWRRDGEVSAVRDYFKVEDEDGQVWWLFRRGDGIDSETGDLRWFLHGVF